MIQINKFLNPNLRMKTNYKKRFSKCKLNKKLEEKVKRSIQIFKKYKRQKNN